MAQSRVAPEHRLDSIKPKKRHKIVPLDYSDGLVKVACCASFHMENVFLPPSSLKMETWIIIFFELVISLWLICLAETERVERLHFQLCQAPSLFISTCQSVYSPSLFSPWLNPSIQIPRSALCFFLSVSPFVL